MSAGHDDRFRDDAAAWLLGALPEQEAAAFTAHLETCAACRSEVEELRAAVEVLPTAVPVVAPPAELRDRIMSVVEAEAEVLRAAGPTADRPARAARRPRWFAGLRPAFAVAAASIALVAAGAGFGIGRLGGGVETRTVTAQVAAESGRATLRLRDGDGRLEVRGLPAPPAGRVYQVWLLPEGEGAAPRPTTTLFSVTRDGRGAAEVPDVGDAQAVLVSDEPVGGSSAPTGEVVITAPLA